MPRQSKKKSLDTSTVIRLQENYPGYFNQLVREAITLLSDAATSLDYEMKKGVCPNLIGTLRLVYSHIATMETKLLMLGPLDTTVTPTKKLKDDWTARGPYRAPLHASTSTRSTQKRAKPARTGKKSNHRSFSDIQYPEVKYKATIHKRWPKGRQGR
jgi:hypothetical protein